MGVVFMVYSICLLSPIALCVVEKSGPYKTTLTKTGPCQTPTLPLDKDPPMSYYVEIYNTTKKANLLRGNATVFRDTRNKKIKVKGYSWQDGKWEIHYIMNNMGCHSVILPVIATAAAIKYDRKNCKFFKGHYAFSEIDVNWLQHMWMSDQEYGRIRWINEIFSEAGTIICWEYETLVEPAIKI